TYATGPRVVDSTMGLVHRQAVVALDGESVEFNAGRDPSNGVQAFDGFIVTFDRPVDPNSFGIGDVVIQYRNVTTSGSAPPPRRAPAAGVVPRLAARWARGLPGFLALLPPQSATGTYSYQVGPGISDRIRSVTGAGTSLGNAMDQSANGVAGEAGGDV